MTTELTGLTINEISVVDDPANPEAVISIFKAKRTPPADAKADDEDTEDGADDEDTEGEGKKAMPFSKLAQAVLEALEDASEDIIGKALSAGFADDPDAAAAAAAIFQEIVMGGEATAKTLDEANAQIADLQKRLTTATNALVDKDAALTAEIAKNQAPANGELTEEVLKGLPEAVRKRLEQGEADRVALQKAAEKAETDTAIAKAKELRLADPDKAGAALARIRKGKSTAEDADLIEGLFRAAAAQITTGALFKALGNPADNPTGDDPEAVLKAKAEEIQKAKPTMTAAAAYAEAVDKNPDVYAMYVAKRRLTQPAA